MKTQELIYARVKIHQPPDGKRLHLSKDCTEIFYYNKKEKVKVELCNNNDILMKQSFNFIKTKLITDGINGWYKILLDIDIDQLNETLRCPYNINGRKHLFEIFRKCITETKNNYISHLILNLYDNILTRNKKESFLESFIQHESCDISFTYLQENMYKLGEYYIDTLNGQFMKETPLQRCGINGGIIYDTTCIWVKQLLSSIKDNIKKNNIKNIVNSQTLIYTKCTIIICDKMMCNYWLCKIKLINSQHIVKIINTMKDHKSLLYSELLELDYLIISYEYLSTKKYISVFDDYNINNNKMESILKIIKNEYGNFDNIKDRSDVIFSLLTWNRIIIDTHTFYNSLKDNDMYELIMTFKAARRWVHINKMPDNQTEYINLFKYVSNDKDMTFPLYNTDSNIGYIDNIMYVHNNKESVNINEKCIIIKSGLLEKNVLKYLEKIKCNDIYKFYNIINNLYETMINRQQYVDMLDRVNMNAQFDDLQCAICFNVNDYDEMLFTNCGHYYCVGCILENLDYNKSCPMCRKELTINELHYIDDNCTNDKADELIKTIQPLNTTVYIYVNDCKHKKYLSKYLKNYGLNCKIEWIYNDFNRIQKLINIESSNNMCIIFYDIYDEIEKIKNHLKSTNFGNIQIYYLIYDILKSRLERK